MFVSAFICHHNSFLIYGSLKDPTLSNWSRITHMSVSFAVFVSLVFATCGYVTFRGYTEGNVHYHGFISMVYLCFQYFSLAFLPEGSQGGIQIHKNKCKITIKKQILKLNNFRIAYNLKTINTITIKHTCSSHHLRKKGLRAQS